MALEVGKNSYITLEDANTYFADRLNSTEWDSATDPDKSKALIQATKIIDTKQYFGYKTSETQLLKFPRIGLCYDGVKIDSSIVHQNVKDAVCELAIWLLQDDFTAPNDLAQFNSVELGALKVETSSNQTKGLPPLVSDLLKPFMDTSRRLVRG